MTADNNKHMMYRIHNIQFILQNLEYINIHRLQNFTPFITI